MSRIPLHQSGPGEFGNFCNRLLGQVMQINQGISPKKTRGSSRMIAKTDRDPATLLDSTTYTYLSNYGYDETNAVIPTSNFLTTPVLYRDYQQYFDRSYHYSHGGSTMELADSTACSFNASHSIRNEFADSVLSNTKDSILYTYTANQQISAMVERGFDAAGSGLWVNKTRTGYTYVSNIVSSITHDNWDAATNTWLPDYRYDLTYTGIYPTTWTGFDFDGANWLPFVRLVLALDSTNQLMKFTSQYYDTSNTWVNSMEKRYGYDSSGRLNSITDWTWNWNWWDHWTFDRYDTILYDGGSMPAAMLEAAWDTSSIAWTPLVLKKEYTYTGDQKIQEIKYYLRDSTAAPWVLQQTEHYDYQFYSANQVDDILHSGKTMLVYPNPVSGEELRLVTSEKIKQKKVYDFTGRSCYAEYDEQPVVKTEYLALGTYLLSVVTTEGEYQANFQKV